MCWACYTRSTTISRYSTTVVHSSCIHQGLWGFRWTRKLQTPCRAPPRCDASLLIGRRRRVRVTSRRGLGLSPGHISFTRLAGNANPGRVSKSSRRPPVTPFDSVAASAPLHHRHSSAASPSALTTTSCPPTATSPLHPTLWPPPPLPSRPPPRPRQTTSFPGTSQVFVSFRRRVTWLTSRRVEKFRPLLLDDIVGNTETVERLKIIAKDGNMPHVIISGMPGIGCVRSQPPPVGVSDPRQKDHFDPLSGPCPSGRQLQRGGARAECLR